jgi:2-oxoglutarate ferredoxin oxidoreductase subunit alpha
MNKVANIAHDIPLLDVSGPPEGDLLVLGWGGTFGAITSAAEAARSEGKSVASAHLRYLNPFPANIETVLRSYKKVLIPELNTGQLSLLIRGKFLIDAIPFNKVTGQPFKIRELQGKIDEVLGLRGPYVLEFPQGSALSGG